MKRLLAGAALCVASFGALAQSYTFIATPSFSGTPFRVDLSSPDGRYFGGTAHVPGNEMELLGFSVYYAAPDYFEVFGFVESGYDFGPLYDGTYSSFGAFAQSYGLNDKGINSYGTLQLLAVPEPETYALLGAGLLLMAGWARRRQQT